MFYTLAQPKNARYQDKLRKELSTLPIPLNFKDVCNLPYLNILVLEVLRLYAPGPGGLQQRVVPPSSKSTVFTVEGKNYELPSNTMVGIQAYSSQ